MLDVTRLFTRSFDLDHVDLFWEVADLYNHQSLEELVLAYDFFVLRSEAPEGPYDILTGPFQDMYSFRDASPALLQKWRNLFYKLRVVDRRNNETRDFGPTGQIPEPDLIALEIMRQEDVLFREFVGRRCWVFPVRTFGAKCICYDRVKGKRTRSNCVTCYDTGYLGGYMRPVECFIQVDPNPNNNQNTALGKQQTNNTSARLISYPPINPNDIIVESENKRWKVVTVATTQRLRADVRQELTLHEIPRGDVEYKLPINLDDVKALIPSARRNFTNPQNIDNVFIGSVKHVGDVPLDSDFEITSFTSAGKIIVP
jgi:hypothetical protein